MIVVTLLECLGSDTANKLAQCFQFRNQRFHSHISHTITSKHQRRSKLLFREARDVTANHSQAHAESKTLEVAQPKRNQASPGRARGQADKHCSAGNTDQVGDHHGGTARVGPFTADEATTEKGGELHEATGDLQVLGAEGAEAEVFDDEGCEL